MSVSKSCFIDTKILYTLEPTNKELDTMEANNLNLLD